MDAIYSKNPDIIFRRIAEEFILVPVRQKAVDLRSVYTLNETAAFIWGLIDGKKSLSLIEAEVSEAFDVESRRVEADVSHIVSQWESLELVKKA
ncbi:MAG TPA: PqqD family protein [Candidatus Omnitrophota bacterium]|nr:PqqD family protein [Candidatus Omnitrophota bacterium]HNQ50589.1 PqqD family protein [Candidatus Omnitrophota bacterium]HQO38587.1 PqqD family protein [Candidatus Omnitrophota bacterium]HQQ06225.1 PqqD family protein [Candidatus Omnitrophota bacterium]